MHGIVCTEGVKMKSREISFFFFFLNLKNLKENYVLQPCASFNHIKSIINNKMASEGNMFANILRGSILLLCQMS